MNIIVNQKETESPDGMTVAELIDSLNLKRAHVAVEVNLELIPRESHTQHQLKDGDQIEIVTLVGGG